jgi:hypothetical protein
VTAGEEVKWPHDTQQQDQPEQESTEGKETGGNDDPVAEVDDDSERNMFRALNDNCPTKAPNGKSAVEPALPPRIAPLSRRRLSVKGGGGAGELGQSRLQEACSVRCPDEPSLGIDDADDKVLALLPLGVDDVLKGLVEIVEFQIHGEDAGKHTGSIVDR